MIDEQSRRKSTFVEGHQFLMSDGQLWHLAEPVVDWYPKFIEGKVSVTLATDFGPEFDDAAERAGEKQTWLEIFGVAFTLADRMLRRNYELSDDEVSSLLRHRMGDDDSRAKWFTVIGVARGEVPKHSPVGSD